MWRDREMMSHQLLQACTFASPRVDEIGLLTRPSRLYEHVVIIVDEVCVRDLHARNRWVVCEGEQRGFLLNAQGKPVLACSPSLPRLCTIILRNIIRGVSAAGSQRQWPEARRRGPPVRGAGYGFVEPMLNDGRMGNLK